MNDKDVILANKETLDPCKEPMSAREWSRFGFYILSKILDKLNGRRFELLSFDREIKSDGSPATEFEKEIEQMTIETLKSFYPNSGFIGEELGNIDGEREIKVIIDPIDGTQSFLSGFDTYTSTLSIVRGDSNLFSLILVPPTKEFSYRIGDETSKIAEYGIFDIKEFPLINLKASSPTIINIHPASSSFEIIRKLYELWNDKKIVLVKSVSGSPALNIIESAKSNVIYINAWARGGTQPYDLLGPNYIAEGAGAFIINAKGHNIDPVNHKGLLLSGRNKDKLLEILKELDDNKINN